MPFPFSSIFISAFPFSLLPLLTLFTSTLALPPPSPQSKPPLPPPILHFNLTVSSDLPRCKREATWSTLDGFQMSDCTAALHRFYNVQVQPLLRTDIEFLGMNAMPEYKHPPDLAVTPRKYVDGSCTLAIAMINFYPRSVLRERGPGTFEDTDVSRYVKVWMRLHEIIFGCMGPGWGAVGDMSQSIGVFVWVKDSEMDRRTPSMTIA